MRSVRQIANQSGSVTLGQAYDPFGNTLGWSGLGGSSYGYAGEWSDGSGLQYLRARYYSPSTGRFISKDPFPGLLTQPASLTPYVYALNNPVLLNDPSGENPLLLVGGLGGLLGGAIYGYGSQVVRNLNQGMCFWDALSTDIDAGHVALYAGVGTVLGLGMGGSMVGIQALAGYLGAGTTIGTTLSADGDPTNEVRGIAQATRKFTGETLPTVSKPIDEIANGVEEWVGQGGGLITIRNKAGDFILRNFQNTRRFRFDYNDSTPHTNPHMHLEWLDETGEWISKRIWPYDVESK